MDVGDGAEQSRAAKLFNVAKESIPAQKSMEQLFFRIVRGGKVAPSISGRDQLLRDIKKRNLLPNEVFETCLSGTYLQFDDPEEEFRSAGDTS